MVALCFKEVILAKIKVKVEKNKRIYIHNDLMNAAHHLKKNVLRVDAAKEPGITLHIMGALAMLAFAFEAQINFIGFKCVSNWKERDAFQKKSNKIFSALKMKPDFKTRPYSSINKLKEFRDFVAHGKPIELTECYEEIVDQDEEEFELRTPIGHEGFCTLSNLIEVTEDLQIVWKELLSNADIIHYDSITTSSGGQTFIEHVE